VDLKTMNRGKLNTWIDLNVGPIPPEKIPERVTSIIDRVIEPEKFLSYFVWCSSGD
jgi:hypothetical protein